MVYGYTLHTDMKVLDIGAFDAILGFDWLKQNSPMTCDWEHKTLQFQQGKTEIKLQGISLRQTEVTHLPADKVYKWWKGNDIWAMVMLAPGDQFVPTNVDQQVDQLLSTYQDVFQDSKKLPSERVYDHTIPLLPNAIPVNARPYRYSPLHKDEIERQVREMLDAGLIVPSTSPFASPVLLIQKKDGSWRFCVDYRRLNDLTIKNRFPMPLIEEIIAELAGSSYFTKLDMKSGYHQVRMKGEDEYKTAFKTHHGHYQFKVMPFGLTNAPATFSVYQE